MPTYRIIITLRLDLGPIPGGGPTSRRELIVNLTRDGTNRLKGGCRPRPPKTRIIDLRPGDDILHDGQWCKVYGIEAFLATTMTDAEAMGTLGEGYVYRIAETEGAIVPPGPDANRFARPLPPISDVARERYEEKMKGVVIPKRRQRRRRR